MYGLESGQRFERYRVLRVLGSGVSGTSYEAEDLVLHHKVTLKLIHPWATLADSARRQFFRDMQSISLLVHPFHATMHDYGEVEGQLYVARRFVDHGSLLSPEGRSLFSPPFSIADTLSYAYQLAQVLYNIHRYGYVHGSLTLSNILVLHDPNDTGKAASTPFLLSDIGLAYFVRRFGHPQITRLPITAAPEQWKGRYTPASDQYALAVLVYLWLTGRPPFIGSPEEIEQAKHKVSFPLLSSFNPQITLEQEGIMRRALNAYPDARYPTIVAFIEAIQTSFSKQVKPQEDHAPASPGQGQALSLREQEPFTYPAEEIDARPSDENGMVVGTDNATNAQVEPISSTFLLDQEAILRLTTLAKEEKSLSEPTSPSSQSEETPLPPAEPAPETVQIESASPLAQSGETPSSPVESAPETPQTEPEPAILAEPVEPAGDGLAPSQSAPDIVQAVPEPTAPSVGEKLAPLQATPPPSSTTQKTAEPPQRSAKLITTLTVTSPYLSVPQEFHLEKDEITVGRAGSSDILLDQDQQTSRHHAMLRRQDDQYYIYDQLSSSGVIVNGKKLTPGIGCPLADGDCIYICSYTLTLHLIPTQHDHESKKESAIS
jgi:serine/threonine protein kinase